MSSFVDGAQQDFEEFSRFVFFQHLIPSACERDAVLFPLAYTKLPLPTTIRTITILDAPNGKSRAYQLPEECFAIANLARNLVPTIDIELLNKEGQSLGSKIEGWNQVESAQTVGARDVRVFQPKGGQGSRVLYVGLDYAAAIAGLVTFPWKNNSDPDRSFIYVPGLTGRRSNERLYFITSSAVFPYRFLLDAAETAANPEPKVSVSVEGPVTLNFN